MPPCRSLALLPPALAAAWLAWMDWPSPSPILSAPLPLTTPAVHSPSPVPASFDSPREQTSSSVDLAVWLTEENAADLLRALPPDLIETPPAAEALARWSAQDPAAALAWLATLGQTPAPHIVTVLRTWLASDPAALRRHLAALPASPWQQQLLAHSGRLALQQNHPADAARWLSLLAPETRSAPELLCAVNAWGRNDLASAIEWASADPSPAEQETLLSAALVGHAATDPDQALDLALGLLDPAPARDQALAELMAEWAHLNPSEAASALARFPEGEARDKALGALLATWHDYDPPAARAWVVRAPEPMRSRARSALDLLATAH